MNRELLRLGAILGLLSSIGPFAIDMYLPALPTVASDLRTTIPAGQATIMTFLIAFGLGQIIYGPLSDQLGRTPPLYIGLVVFIVGSVMCVMAPTIQWLIFARCVQGLGAAAMSVIPRAIVRDRFTGPEATRLMSTIMIVVSVSPLFAPLLGSGIILFGSWRLIFGFLCLLSLVALALTNVALEETLPTEKSTQINVRSFVTGTSRLFHHRQFMLMTLINSTSLSSFFVFIASAPFVYTQMFGLSPTEFSLVFAINALSFFSASQFAAPLTRKFGPQRVVFGAVLGFATLTTLLMVLSMMFTLGIYQITGILFFANAFLGLVIPTASVQAIDDHGDIAGLASSVGGSIQWMFGGVVILLVGPFFDGSTFPMTASIAACGIAALVLAGLVKYKLN